MKIDKNDVDTASLWVISEKLLNVFILSDECSGCDFSLFGKVVNGSSRFTLSTKYGTEVELRTEKEKLRFNSTNFQYKGSYKVNATSGLSNAKLETLDKPQDPYICILWMLTVFICLIFLWIIVKLFHRYNCFRSADTQRLLITDLGSPDDPNSVLHISVSEDQVSTQNSKRRLHCLDAFRGLCLVLMIFVEYGGGKFYFFEHARWNGLTFADVVFPWFMWIMGVSSALSVQYLLRRGVSKKWIFFKIVKRSILLILLGLYLNTLKDGWNFDKMRIMGVLQRFGLTYFIVASLDLPFHNVNDAFQGITSRWGYFRDLQNTWVQWLVMLAFVVIHTAITFMLHVDGCSTGYLGPGGLEDHGHNFNCTGGAAGYIDRMVLGTDHMYQKPTCQVIYQTSLPYDPEGLLGTLTATFMVFLGLHAGKIAIAFIDHKGRIYRWLFWALVTGIIGTVLCLGKKDDGYIPVNKNLWSLSFVLLLSSMAYLILTVFYFFIDNKSFWSGAPFYYPGMNSILLYVGENLTKNKFPFGWNGCTDHDCYMWQALWGTTLWVIIAFYLYRMKIFMTL